MKWLVALAAAWVLNPAFALVIGVYELPPHMVVDGQPEVSGAVVDFVKEVIPASPEWGPVELRASNFARNLRALEAGQIDMVVMVAKNAQREKLFRYASAPLFLTRSGVVVLKSRQWSRLDALEQLRGFKVGHANGSIVPAYFQNLGIEFQPISGDEYFNRGLKMVELGRHDAYFAPTLTNAQYLLQRVEGGAQFTVLPLPVEPLGLYVVFSKTMNEKAVLKLDALISNNAARYKELLRPYTR